MIIGLVILELHLPDCYSLKQKRSVVKSFITRVRDRFNVSISEIDDHDLWQKAIIGVACVGNDKVFINKVLDKVVDFVETYRQMQLLDVKMSFI